MSIKDKYLFIGYGSHSCVFKIKKSINHENENSKEIILDPQIINDDNSNLNNYTTEATLGASLKHSSTEATLGASLKHSSTHTNVAKIFVFPKGKKVKILAKSKVLKELYNHHHIRTNIPDYHEHLIISTNNYHLSDDIIAQIDTQGFQKCLNMLSHYKHSGEGMVIEQPYGGKELFQLMARANKKDIIPDDNNILANYLFQDIQEVIYCFRQLLIGVKKFHDSHMTHLDLKLENVVYHHTEKKYRIIDFGSSIIIPNLKQNMQLFVDDNTKEWNFSKYICDVLNKGTISYLPPEIIGLRLYYPLLENDRIAFKTEILELGMDPDDEKYTISDDNMKLMICNLPEYLYKWDVYSLGILMEHILMDFEYLNPNQFKNENMIANFYHLLYWLVDEMQNNDCTKRITLDEAIFAMNGINEQFQNFLDF